jgi:hypothetical protein
METQAQYVARRRRELEAERRRTEVADLVQRGLHRLDESPTAKALAGNIAGNIGGVLGVGRGLWHDVEAIRQGAQLVGNLVNPGAAGHDHAVHSVVDGAKGAANYVVARASQPSLLVDDASRFGAHLNRDLNPSATPAAGTFVDEMRRRLDVGMNQGEAAYNLASIVLPVGGEVKSALELGRLAEAGPAKYLRIGATPEQAIYMAEKDFDTLGHHGGLPRAAKTVGKIPVVKKIMKSPRAPQMPQWLLDAPVPRLLVENPFNVVRPPSWAERGQWYRRHAGIDDHYGGGPAPAAFGGGGWSARKLGWTRYGPAERILYGTPGATKAVVYGVPTSLDALGRAVPDDDGAW